MIAAPAGLTLGGNRLGPRAGIVTLLGLPAVIPGGKRPIMTEISYAGYRFPNQRPYQSLGHLNGNTRVDPQNLLTCVGTRASRDT